MEVGVDDEGGGEGEAVDGGSAWAWFVVGDEAGAEEGEEEDDEAGEGVEGLE